MTDNHIHIYVRDGDKPIIKRLRAVLRKERMSLSDFLFQSAKQYLEKKEKEKAA